jgi:hypothetical protein
MNINPFFEIDVVTKNSRAKKTRIVTMSSVVESFMGGIVHTIMKSKKTKDFKMRFFLSPLIGERKNGERKI